MSLSTTRLTTLPDSLDLPNARYFIVSPYILWLGKNRGPRLGPQDKTPSLSRCSIRVEGYIGLDSCCKQEDHRRCVYMYTRQEGQAYTQSHGNLQKRGSMVRAVDRARQAIRTLPYRSLSDLMVFFLPLMQYGCYLEVLPLTSPLEAFYAYISALIYIDFNWDRIRR